MFRKISILMAIVLVFSACQLQAAQIPVSWDGGGWGLWEDPNNWDPNIVPDNDANTFVVTIDGNSIGIDELEVGLQEHHTILQLDCHGEVELLAWTEWNDTWVALTINPNDLTNHGDLAIGLLLEIVGNIENYGYLELSDVEVDGNVTNYDGGKLEFESPGPEINGNLYNLPGGKVQIESLAVIKEGNIDNAGTMTVYSGAQLWFENQFHNTGQIKLNGGLVQYWEEESGQGMLDNNSPGAITGFGMVDANQLIQNKGTIYASGGSLLLRSNSSITNTGTLGNKPSASLHIKPVVNVNNNGTIEINAGGGVAFDCNVVNEPNGIIELLGGTLAATTITQTADANFAGFGSITGDVFIDPNGLIKLTGPTNIVGDVEIGPNATLEISDGTTLVTGHTTNNGTIHMKGGRIIPQGGFTNNGSIIWEPGTYNNIADFNLDGQVNFKDFAYFADTWLWQASWY